MKEIRRSRLIALLSSPRFLGDRAKFCQDAGITKGRLTQLLDPKEPFGELAARNLSDALRLDSGYFENQPNSKTEPVELVETQSTRMDLDWLLDKIEDPLLRVMARSDASAVLISYIHGHHATPDQAPTDKPKKHVIQGKRPA